MNPWPGGSALLRPAARCGTVRVRDGEAGMRHYRVNKLAKAGGMVVKRKDILADNDRQAVARAESDDDCPVCDVWRDGTKIGSIT